MHAVESGALRGLSTQGGHRGGRSGFDESNSGRQGFRLTSLRTVQAAFPHTVLQSLVSDHDSLRAEVLKLNFFPLLALKAIGDIREKALRLWPRPITFVPSIKLDVLPRANIERQHASECSTLRTRVQRVDRSGHNLVRKSLERVGYDERRDAIEQRRARVVHELGAHGDDLSDPVACAQGGKGAADAPASNEEPYNIRMLAQKSFRHFLRDRARMSRAASSSVN
jgi:hypothetical protein